MNTQATEVEKMTAGSDPGDEQPDTPALSDDGKFEVPDFGELTAHLEGDDEDTRDLELPDGSGSEKDGTGGEAAPASGTTAAVPSSSSDATPTTAPTAETAPATAEVPAAVSPPVEAPKILEQTSEATQPSKEVAPEVPQVPQKSFEELKAELLPELERHYALPEDIAAELKSADSLDSGEALVKVLPKLAARMHLEMQASVVQLVGQAIPQMVDQQMRFKATAERLESNFYDRWPKLKGKDERLIAQSVQAYRMVNPKANEQELIERAGAMAMLNLGLDPLAETRVAAPAAPPAPPPPPPFTPASPGNTAAPIFTPQKQDNFFAALAEDFMKEDLG